MELEEDWLIENQERQMSRYIMCGLDPQYWEGWMENTVGSVSRVDTVGSVLQAAEDE